jgi:hypothetical protein
VLTIGMAYFLAAVAASGVFIVAGWRSKKMRGLVAAQDRHDLLTDPLWADAEIDINAPQSQADVGAAMRLALKRLAPVMASQSVRADIAAPSGLPVRMRGAALADLLEELLTAAVHGAPASRLLMTAAPHGDRVHVGITDDMPGADLAVRLGSLRGLMERVAMRGGALDVDVRPAEGTTMTLRLAAAKEQWWDNTDSAPSEPVKELSALPSGVSGHAGR